MLDFRMQTFLTVCEEMNYTKAAERLHITQPAVSQHIHYLEQHYGCALFTFTGKKLNLTNAGKLLLNAMQTQQHDETRLMIKMTSFAYFLENKLFFSFIFIVLQQISFNFFSHL